MTGKKLKLLFIALSVCVGSAIAQGNISYSVYDSSVIPKNRLPQQNEFWNNSYNFPAKPRNQWEVGASVGMMTISGDIPAKLGVFGFEAHVRKAFGYIFSMRLQYLNSNAKGMHWLISENYAKNSAWTAVGGGGNLPAGRGYAAAWRTASGPLINTPDKGVTRAASVDPVYYNYKAKVQDLGLQGIVTLNNIRFHKAKTGVVIYGGAGIGATVYETKVNSLDAGGNNYSTLFRNVYNGFSSGVHKSRKDVLDALKNGYGGAAGMDKTYETAAENHGARRPKIGNGTLKPSGTVLAGFAYRLSKRVNISLEDRWTFTKDDLLDGQRWQEHAYGDAVHTRDFDSYNFLSLGVNVNLGGKSVEPLWWNNPLEYAYDEFPNKKIKLPKPECADADGDGVCDHLDTEPGTPAGCPVDTHGVTRDTDGDGVPDCKDKQLITPTECQPVDADGIGKCPEPPCCTTKPPVETTDCGPCDYPTLSFGKGVNSLSAANKGFLNAIAKKLKDRENCSITLVGHPGTSKADQNNCQKRLEAAKRYLVEVGGVPADKIETSCEVGDGGDESAVDVKCN
jgi:OmpA-OmpF porin, OOP family